MSRPAPRFVTRDGDSEVDRRPASVLDEIVARSRTDAHERERRMSLRALQRAVHETGLAPPRDFQAALHGPGLSLIAEFKPRSPSRGPLRPVTDLAQFATLYGQRADAISVLCDTPFFGGGYQLLAQMRSSCDRPLLCKDFIVGEYQIWEARAHGADAVLLLASVHDAGMLRALMSVVHELGMHALVEAHTPAEIETALACDARIVGINSRDLTTLGIDTGRLTELRRLVPPGPIVVAESGIQSRAHVEPLRGTFDAVLIGTAFMTASDPAACMSELGW